jgi:hypothetical protein
VKQKELKLSQVARAATNSLFDDDGKFKVFHEADNTTVSEMTNPTFYKQEKDKNLKDNDATTTLPCLMLLVTLLIW